MRILGIDPGLNRTGFGIIDVSSSNTYVTSGIINSSKLSFNEKLGNINIQLQKIIDTYNPVICSIENFFIGKYVKSIMYLAQARGACISVISANNIELHEYSPKTIKKRITGSGNASKETLRQLTFQQLKIFGSSITSDSSDALAIALAHSLLLASHQVGL